jgi:hypothetical protein
MEYIIIAFALLLVAGSAAVALAVMWIKLDRRICSLERVVSKRLSKIEAAVSEKASGAECRDIAMMLDGVASVSRRLEKRISDLESEGKNPPRASTDR